MALIGQGRHTLDQKLFDDATQTWPAEFTPAAEYAYSGQGFQFPEDRTWVNRTTGTAGDGGMVMGFPRSAEFQPEEPAGKWYVSES